MATATKKTGHDERTASEPRDDALHIVTVAKVLQVNSTIRTFQLLGKRPISFQAGQWLDTFLPGLPKPGGFTITSEPALAAATATAVASASRVDLAVQKSDDNPAAAWLWQDLSTIVNRKIKVRVGGSFIWPPPQGATAFKHVLFVAGGVGINPLISMVKQFRHTEQWPEKVTFLYSSKVSLRDDDGEVEDVLFLDELKDVIKASNNRMSLHLFLTGMSQQAPKDRFGPFEARRIDEDDLVRALGDDAKQTICYVCGVPSMTDTFVQFLTSRDDMSSDRVLCEKWW